MINKTIKNSTAIIIIILALILIAVHAILLMSIALGVPNCIFIKTKQRALVVKVEENYLGTILLDEENSIGEYVRLCNVSFDKRGNIGFKQGQEILVYYNGIISQMFPSELERGFKN